MPPCTTVLSRIYPSFRIKMKSVPVSWHPHAQLNIMFKEMYNIYYCLVITLDFKRVNEHDEQEDDQWNKTNEMRASDIDKWGNETPKANPYSEGNVCVK